MRKYVFLAMTRSARRLSETGYRTACYPYGTLR
jgi:hypothetical protein